MTVSLDLCSGLNPIVEFLRRVIRLLGAVSTLISVLSSFNEDIQFPTLQALNLIALEGFQVLK